jgi:uncharacterized LabA/DUF88 family protein
VAKFWVYIDGFNLYNGARKDPALAGTSWKWLDLLKLSRLLVTPPNTVERVKFFTAAVSGRPGDRTMPTRQQAYWRALRTLPEVEIIEGYFLGKPKWVPLSHSVKYLECREAHLGAALLPDAKPQMVEVFRWEEKGTDVNLAAHLVNDAHRRRFDRAMVISNDSDLKEAIRIVRSELKMEVGIFHAHHKSPSVELRKAALFFRRIKKSDFVAAQFPAIMSDASGTFHRPATWSAGHFERA